MLSFQTIQSALCFLQFPVTGSSAFMIFSKQFSTYTQSTLMRLKSVFEITSFAPLPPRSRNKEQYLGDFLQTL